MVKILESENEFVEIDSELPTEPKLLTEHIAGHVAGSGAP